MNIGFLESLKFNDFDCFMFHDVDLFNLSVGPFSGEVFCQLASLS